MIESLGDKSKFNSKDIEAIVETCVFESIVTFGNFFDLLGIDSSLFTHLMDNRIIIDYTSEFGSAIACYLSNENGDNTIHIGAIYINNLLDILKKNNNIVEYKNIIDEITATIVHEVIHSNRDIYINNSINLNNLMHYEEKFFNIHYTKLNKDFYGVSSDHLWSFNEDISTLSLDEIRKYREKLIRQIGIEESLTEAFANIMVFHKNKKELKIKEFCNLMLNSNLSDNLNAAFYLISNMSINDIKWFYLSSYEDIYNDRFYTLFNKDYNRIISYFYNFYINEKKKPHQESKYDKCIKLIDKHLKK